VIVKLYTVCIISKSLTFPSNHITCRWGMIGGFGTVEVLHSEGAVLYGFAWHRRLES